MSDDKRERTPTPSARPIERKGSPHPAEFTHPGSPSRASTTARLGTPVYGSPSGSRPLSPQRSPRSEQDDEVPLAGASVGSATGPGTSSLSQALRGTLGKIGTTPTGQQEQPGRLASPERKPRGLYGSFASQTEHLGRSPRATEDIEVLKRHLAGPQPSASEPESYRRQSSLAARGGDVASSQPHEEEFSSLRLQGGDTTRHIYRYAERREREQAEVQDRETGRLRRSLSVSQLQTPDAREDDAQSIKVPGGFRRDHLRRTAGSPAPSGGHARPDYGTTIGRAHTEPARPQRRFVTSNFIEFLTLYGHFAGEELDEDDEVLGPDEYFSSDAATPEAEEGRSDDDGDGGWGEDSALLTPGKRKRRRKHRETGNGTPFGAALLLLKSFVGTGVLFLPRAYLNGGMVFSNLVLLFIALLSYYCFLLLVSVRLKIPASFGDMGERVFGGYFRNLINFSLVISQIGFSSAYTVFVGENLQAFILAVSYCRTFVDIKWLILLQTLVFLPLSLYRNINNIQKMALVADLFICLGLIYLYYYDIRTLVSRPGVADIASFNSNSWTLFIGTAIFTFEGIGLIIPIQSGMREPHKFPMVLGRVMVIMSVIFISMGALSYAAYGSHTQTVIILNLPQHDPLVNGVQLLYSLAILMSTPLQIYPAIEITSQQLFSKTGKYNPRIKWKKNIFRFFMVIFVSLIAWFGANDLDKFVSIVGSFACIPLVYIYAPLLHYRVVATKTWQRVSDLALVVFGFIVMAYTTALTINAWVHGAKEKAPGYCDR